ncbi:MAG TPA: SCO2322 family protein [Candidatus Nanopelagicales bacterium]
MTITRSRRAAGLLVACMAVLIAGVGLAAPASATAYRYWSYWQGASGTWVAAQTGPGDYSVVDQDVQGWRFAITTDQPAQAPDNAPAFATLCPTLAASTAPEGQVRVAVVVDGGFAADAPVGQAPGPDVVSCVTVPAGSTGNQALAAAATTTIQDGLVCAVNGYPTDECGAEVSDADAAAAAAKAAAEQPNPAVVTAASGTAAADGTTTSTSSPVGLLLGGAVVFGLLAAAWLIPAARRRQRAAARTAREAEARAGAPEAPAPGTTTSDRTGQ